MTIPLSEKAYPYTPEVLVTILPIKTGNWVCFYNGPTVIISSMPTAIFLKEGS
ncbi:hypothetical protein D3C72_2341850 [compost metagenome]